MTNTDTDTYFKLSLDAKCALDLFKKNLDRAEVFKKNGSSIILFDGGKIISVIIFRSDMASIINADDMSFTCINKAFQAPIYSAVGDVFNQVLTKFEYNSSLLNDSID